MVKTRFGQKSTKKTNITPKIIKKKIAFNPINRKKLRAFILKKIEKQQKESPTKIAKFEERLRSKEIESLIIAENYDCPICLQLVLRAAVMECGHIYCLKCLQENAACSVRCCQCRRQQQKVEVQESHWTNRVINNLILPKTQNALNYWLRHSDFKKWENRRRLDVTKVKAGDFIDVRDKSLVWRKGVLKSYTSNQKGDLILQVYINVFGEETTLNIESTSREIANFTFFSKSQYLKQRNEAYSEHLMEDREVQDLDYDFDQFNHYEDGSNIDMFLNIGEREDRSSQGQHEEAGDFHMNLFDFEMQGSDNLL